jgi:S-adenosylmethionine hydrolase
VPLVTLTTDFGSNSFYAAALKGALYRHIPGVQVVDISHAVSPHDITQAAFLVRNSYGSFPLHTIHLLGVDTEIHLHEQYLLVEHQGQYFIGADNGIFSLIFDDAPVKVYRLKRFSPEGQGLEWWVQAAARLFESGKPEDVGEPTQVKNTKQNFKPMVDANGIRGHVVFIDHYKNVITNISKTLFDEVGRGRRFRIRFRRTEELDRISNYYSAVEPGERVCLFGETGFLEIAMNKGEAAPLLGLRTDSVIVIEFI